jgi:ribonuclease P
VVAGPLWVVFVADPSVQPPQVAFAFGRALGSAVKRNRARRRLRAILAAREGALAPGLYLVGGGPSLVGMPSSRLDGLVGEALAKLGPHP